MPVDAGVADFLDKPAMTELNFGIFCGFKSQAKCNPVSLKYFTIKTEEHFFFQIWANFEGGEFPRSFDTEFIAETNIVITVIKPPELESWLVADHESLPNLEMAQFDEGSLLILPTFPSTYGRQSVSSTKREGFIHFIAKRQIPESKERVVEVIAGRERGPMEEEPVVRYCMLIMQIVAAAPICSPLEKTSSEENVC